MMELAPSYPCMPSLHCCGRLHIRLRSASATSKGPPLYRGRSQSMSQAQDAAKIIATYSNFLQQNYVSLSARVLFLWDYFITLQDEIQYVWERKFTAATFLFLLNRYVNLVISVLEILEQASFQTAKVGLGNLPHPNQRGIYAFRSYSCGPFTRVLQTLLIFALFIVAAFATLRVYATWNRSWFAALPVLLLALITPLVDIFFDVNQQPILSPPPTVGCQVTAHINGTLYSRLIIVNRATTSAYDAIILILTVARTLRLKEQASRLNMPSGIMGLLLRDGFLYFALLLAINLAQIIVTSQVSGNNLLSYYVSPLTSVLISRFLLDLRRVPRVQSSDVTNPTALTTTLPTMDFTDGMESWHAEERGLSTFGASLRYGGDDSMDTEATAASKGKDGAKASMVQPENIPMTDITIQDA